MIRPIGIIDLRDDLLTLVGERISDMTEYFRRYAAVTCSFIRVNSSVHTRCQRLRFREPRASICNDGLLTNVGLYEQLHTPHPYPKFFRRHERHHGTSLHVTCLRTLF